MAGSSSQNQGNLFQQDFLSFRDYTNDKLQSLDEKMDVFMEHITDLIRNRSPGRELDFVNPFGAREGNGRRTVHVGQMNAKGLFRNPKEVEKVKRKRSMREPFYDEYEMDDEEEFHHRSRNNQEEEDKNLKHLKLVFPTYMEGEEAMEWIKDCNEYLNIYGVNEKRKAAIASMHLHGVHKAWYKSHMVGRESITWAEFSKSFMASVERREKMNSLLLSYLLTALLHWFIYIRLQCSYQP